MRDMSDPGFAGDEGQAPDGVSSALAAYASDPDSLHARTLAKLQGARLLVPVVAVLGEVEHDESGLAHDKTSDMATVMMRGRDGRKALLAFTSTESLTRWNSDARPVPVRIDKAAEAALHDKASAMLIDVAGPVMFVIEESDLRSLAQGYQLVEVAGRYGWAKVVG